MGQDHEALGKVFVAGTGRSGTTLMHRLLGSHPAGFLVPFETKFIVEGDGLLALIPALCENFSVSASDLALIRFYELMGGDLLRRFSNDAIDMCQHYRDHLGAQYYDEPVRDYLAALTQCTLNDFPYPRHFENRAELIALTRRFLSRLFGAPALDNRKTFWVEKTPSNIGAMDLIWELFPEAAIVHIKRDPRGVVHSMFGKPWMPAGFDDSLSFVEQIYWRWMMLKPKLDLQRRRYIEIKLEDLAARPGEIMEQVASVIGITPDFKPHHMAPELVDRWKTEMTPDAKKLCERRLGRYFPLMGYDI